MESIIILVIFYYLFKIFTPVNRKQKSRRRPFKIRYDLDRKQLIINYFEQKMVQGMLSENREVFVTAFCRGKHVLMVTATMGSKNQCRPSDNIYNWGEKSTKIGANEIRQYHNHPTVFGRSFLSRTDKKSNRYFNNILKPYDVNFRSFLVYPGRLGGHSIREY
ncbi:MAG: hypothetical protein U9R17_13075 [Thermodesulfobacteriota bacterium]|nr:hypothetical protein [Thermodesulfobacteriota bacterium]